MTRREAMERYVKDRDGTTVIINAIFDDFESRTCESCTYYHNNIKCIHMDLGMMIPPKGYGCNKWESINK